MRTIYRYNYDLSTLKERRFYQTDKFEEYEPDDELLFDYWDWCEQAMIWDRYAKRELERC